MADEELLALQARLARVEHAVTMLVDALDKVAPHLPVGIGMEVAAMADEARSLLVPEDIDLTSPAES